MNAAVAAAVAASCHTVVMLDGVEPVADVGCLGAMVAIIASCCLSGGNRAY